MEFCARIETNFKCGTHSFTCMRQFCLLLLIYVVISPEDVLDKEFWVKADIPEDWRSKVEV